MDKSILLYGKNNEIIPKEYSLPEVLDPLHEEYGLSIFGSIRNSTSAARKSVVPRVFRFFGMSQLLEGKGWLWTVERGMEEISAGSIIITPPDYLHDYGGKGCPFRENALSFSGPIADFLYRAGIIRQGVVPGCPPGELLSILELAMNPGRESQIEGLVRLQQLVLELHKKQTLSDPEAKRNILDALLSRMMENPGKWWQVGEMADFCSLSESHFRTRFIEHTGISPKKYIDMAKMQLACEKLSGTNDSISGIANSLGYIDSLHFSKRFKLLTGLSPTSYRNKMSRII